MVTALPTFDFTFPEGCLDSRDCADFVEVTELTSNDYYLLGGFIATILDPMTSFYKKDNGNFMSYGLRVNENTLDSQLFADLIQPLIYELHSVDQQLYAGLVIAGVDGFVSLQHFTVM